MQQMFCKKKHTLTQVGYSGTASGVAVVVILIVLVGRADRHAVDLYVDEGVLEAPHHEMCRDIVVSFTIRGYSKHSR